MLRLGVGYVCLRDFPALGRAFKMGEAFPVRQFIRHAASLMRMGLIGPAPTPTHPGASAPSTTDPEVSAAPPADTSGSTFTAVHRGRGRYVVEDQAGRAQHEGTLSKAEAEKLAGLPGA